MSPFPLSILEIWEKIAAQHTDWVLELGGGGDKEAMLNRRDSILMKKEMLIQQAENKVLHLNQWLYGGGIVRWNM